MLFLNAAAGNTVDVPELGQTFGTGWLPPVPDMRDYTEDHPDLAPLRKELGIGAGPRAKKEVPGVVDLREYCSPVENQGSLGSCTAHAAIGVVEYYERRAFGKHLEGSRLFTYKATRNLMGVTGDTGSWLRTTMGALALFGVAPESYWPYTTAKQTGPDAPRTFDDEPTAFVYALAHHFECLRYFCHDPLGQNAAPAAVLESVKHYLAAGVPAMFGFFGFPSFNYADIKGGIPFPGPDEKAQWGHAVAAVGYDDGKVITNTKTGKASKGALLIRNSWGTGWGDAGYGWLPYAYVLNRLAVDFWSVLNMAWVNTGQFGIEALQLAGAAR